MRFKIEDTNLLDRHGSRNTSRNRAPQKGDTLESLARRVCHYNLPQPSLEYKSSGKRPIIAPVVLAGLIPHMPFTAGDIAHKLGLQVRQVKNAIANLRERGHMIITTNEKWGKECVYVYNPSPVTGEAFK